MNHDGVITKWSISLKVDRPYSQLLDVRIAENKEYVDSHSIKGTMDFAVSQRGKKMDELSFTLNNPITEEQWDMISDVDLDNTNEITFYTKHGKEVKFVKAQPERKKGKWRLADIQDPNDKANGNYLYFCSNCFHADLHAKTQEVPYCWFCGAEMEDEYADNN